MTMAWERLHDPEYAGKLNMEQFYDLLIRAGYSAADAREAAKQRGWDRMAAGLTM